MTALLVGLPASESELLGGIARATGHRRSRRPLRVVMRRTTKSRTRSGFAQPDRSAEGTLRQLRGVAHVMVNASVFGARVRASPSSWVATLVDVVGFVDHCLVPPAVAQGEVKTVPV